MKEFLTERALGAPYALAAVVALCAALAQWGLVSVTGARLPFLLFMPAMLLTALFVGRGPGLLVAAIGAAWGSVLMTSTGSLAINDRMALLVYGCVSLALVLVAGRLRIASQRALAAERREAVQLSDLQALHDLSMRLTTIPDVREQLDTSIEALCTLLGASHGLAMLRDERTGVLSVTSSRGFTPAGQQTLARIELPVDSIAATKRDHAALEDLQSDPLMAPVASLLRHEGLHSLLCMPMIGSDGRVIGAVTSLSSRREVPDARQRQLADMIARKAAIHADRARAEQAARRADQRLATALALSPVSFSVLEPARDDNGAIVDFRWVQVNEATARLVNRPQSLLIGQRVSEVLPGAWSEPGLFDRLTTVERTGEVMVFEQYAERNGIEGWFELIVSKVPDGLAIWVNDVTQHKRQAQAMEEADRRKDEFLATLAHELRNPLAPIRQATLVARSAQATEAQKRWSTDVIERQVGHMAMLLDDLLDVSRITRGKLPLRRRETDVREVIERAVEAARPLLDEKRHGLFFDLPPLPIRIDVDVLRLSQVLVNVLTNAAKYTPAGGRIGISARIEETQAVLRIEDNGIGIAPDAIDHVFEMFTQAGSAPQNEGGLGIGLALARGLVELHGGTIDAHSAGPGRGSTFTIRLPMPVALGTSSLVRPAREESVPPRRVLVADDNRDAADSLAEVLRLQGHDVMVAYDGDDAVSQFDSFHPDIALLDIGMPRRSGHEVAAAIRESEAGQHALLVAVTGWGQERDRARSMAAGFDHHLTKPVDPDRLTRLMATAARPH